MLMESLFMANGYTAFILGTALNTTLLWLIVRKSSSELRPYSRILLQVVVVDLATSAFTCLLMPVRVADK